MAKKMEKPEEALYDIQKASKVEFDAMKYQEIANAVPMLKSGNLVITTGEKQPLKISSESGARKNLLVLSLAFTFAWTSFISLQGLQSTLHHRDGVGVLSLTCVYGATIISCILAPLIIHKLTTKGVISGGFALLLLYVTCNFYPVPHIYLPAAILLGLLSGPMWSAQASHLAGLALQHAAVQKLPLEQTISKFTGVFDGFLQISQVTGHLITSVALSDNITKQANIVNETKPHLPCGSSDCGVHNYADGIAHEITNVTWRVRVALFGVHVGCVVMAMVLVAVLLDRSDVTSDTSSDDGMTSCELLGTTLRSLEDPRLQLLIPLVVFIGLTKGFVIGDFTKSFVNCALGVHSIGHVMICFGAVNAVTSFATTYVVKHLKRFPIMGAGALFMVGLLLVLLLWKPRGDDVSMFYVVSSCLGFCDAIFQTQTMSMFGLLFSRQKEAAFSTFRMFQAVGYTSAFAYSYFICVSTKVYILGSALIVSFVLYSAVEWGLRRDKYRRPSTNEVPM